MSIDLTMNDRKTLIEMAANIRECEQAELVGVSDDTNILNRESVVFNSMSPILQTRQNRFDTAQECLSTYRRIKTSPGAEDQLTKQQVLFSLAYLHSSELTRTVKTQDKRDKAFRLIYELNN